MPPLPTSTRLLLPSPPRTSSRSSNSSLTPLSPLTVTTLSLPRSPSPVDWTLTNQWWSGHLPPSSSCLTPSTCRTTHQCVPTTQRYAFPVPQEDPTARSSTNHAVRSADRSAKNPAAPPTVAVADRKPKPKQPPNMSHREMRPSTTWGQYIRTQGGRLPDPGGSTPGPSVSRIFRKEEEDSEDEDTSDDDDYYSHDKNPFPVPTVGCPAPKGEGVDRGRAKTHQKQGTRNDRATSPTPPGFVLNVHPNYIPFKLVDDKTGRQIPAKYVQLFLNNDDPYAYGKMSSTGPTFIAKIQAAPDTDTWEKPSYAAEDTQYFDAKYHDQAEVDAAVSRLCDPSLQAEVRRYRAARYNHRMIARKIDRLEGELFATGMKKCASLRRLMAANAKARIEAKRDEEGFVRVALPWEHVRNTLHVDDLDDGL